MPGTPAASIAASTLGGTYSQVVVAGGGWGAKKGAAATTARRQPAGVARRPWQRPSLRLEAHLRTANGALDPANRRAGGLDCCARGRL